MDKEFEQLIKANDSAFKSNLKQLVRYRDLVEMFVRRDFVAQYKQTILGPIWFFLQPILTALMMTFVFGNIAGLSTDGIPAFLFYLSGIVLWNYFSECLTKTSSTFIDNQQIFGKVYFPRLVVPVSVVTSNLLKLGIQFGLFFVMWLYYYSKGAQISLNIYSLLLPVIIVIAALLGLSLGLLITSLTTKYRDLKFLVQFGVQLAMYASPVVYPLSSVDENMRFWIVLNPMTSLIELFKLGFVGNGVFEWHYLIYSVVFTILTLVISVNVFNRVERNFMDTV